MGLKKLGLLIPGKNFNNPSQIGLCSSCDKDVTALRIVFLKFLWICFSRNPMAVPKLVGVKKMLGVCSNQTRSRGRPVGDETRPR